MQASEEPFTNQHIQDTFQGKIKYNKTVRLLFKKKTLCPKAVAEAGAHQPLLPADLKKRISNKRVRRTKDVNLKATNERKSKLHLPPWANLRNRKNVWAQQSFFSPFSFANSWEREKKKRKVETECSWMETSNM